MSDSLRPHGLYTARLLCPWHSPGNNSRVGCHFLLQGIFLTQGSNPGLLHCRQILYCLSHQGSSKLMGNTKRVEGKGSPQLSMTFRSPCFRPGSFSLCCGRHFSHHCLYASTSGSVSPEDVSWGQLVLEFQRMAWSEPGGSWRTSELS